MYAPLIAVITQVAIVGYQYIQYHQKLHDPRFNTLKYLEQIKIKGTAFIRNVNEIMHTEGFVMRKDFVTLERVQNAVVGKFGQQSTENQYIVKLMYYIMTRGDDNCDEIKSMVASAQTPKQIADHYTFKAIAYALPLLPFNVDLEGSAPMALLKLSIPEEQALQCSNVAQVRALRAGIPIEQALQFSDYVQVYAFKNGIPIEQALQLSKYVQFYALKKAVPIEQALQFSNDKQLSAVEEGVPIEQALQVLSEEQLCAIEEGVPRDQALLFDDYRQCLLLRDGASVEMAMMYYRSISVYDYVCPACS